MTLSPLVPHARRVTPLSLFILPGLLAAQDVRTGIAAMKDGTEDAPGMRRLIRPGDLPAPYATESSGEPARLNSRPAGALPKLSVGLKVEAFATGLTEPRGDRDHAQRRPLCVGKRGRSGRVLRDADGDGRYEINEVFAAHLDKPLGNSFYPAGPSRRYAYVANTGGVVRFPHPSGDIEVTGPGESILNPSAGRSLRLKLRGFRNGLHHAPRRGLGAYRRSYGEQKR